MLENELKPDLGFDYLGKFGNGSTHHLYAVTFFDIIHVDSELYSFTSYPTIDEKDYAATFDFSIKILQELINQMIDNDFKEYLKTVLLKEYNGPEKVDFSDAPISMNIEAILGEPVVSKYETFVPFVIKKISNVKS